MSLRSLLKRIDLTLYAAGFSHESLQWNFLNHNSPFTRLLHVTKGEAFVRFSGKEYRLTPGLLTIVPPHRPVDYFCTQPFAGNYIIFTAALETGKELFSYREFAWQQPVKRHNRGVFKDIMELNPSLNLKINDPKHKDYNDLIWSASAIQQSESTIMKTDGMLRLLLAEFLDYEESREHVSSHSLQRILEVQRYISKNLDKALTLNDLATQVNIHPTYLSDSFMEHTGQRPTQYIQHKKIERSQLLLLSTNKTVRQIATELGFVDPDYFSRVFKKNMGISANNYRKQSNA